MSSGSDHGREADILLLWERAVGLSRWRRDDALLSAEGTPPGTLGARNIGLLAMRNRLFSRRWPLRSKCPACGTDCEFEIDSAALAGELAGMAPQETRAEIEVAGRSLALRAPTVDDLQAVAHLASSKGAATALLGRCVDGEIDLSDIADDELAALGHNLEALDPAAVVTFELACPGCGGEWPAVMDVGEAVWAELRHAAERALIEVDALARAYGWSEDQVMALSPTRRAAYLQLAGAS
ncbi:hypothetical protein [Rhizobium sp. BK251]|uniref:hypothetical protein n=1 Tax=Rhizobium sp. BK251 TaxID=2512125 RepID=UPI0010EC1C32|nr:hypothetical protein [Rhizobium sp. BK251]TCL69510.1 hypothetical protein EV286_10882 [Rhizobium sp. BK251]